MMANEGLTPEYIGVPNLPDDLGRSTRIPEIYSRRVRIVCRSCCLQSVLRLAPHDVIARMRLPGSRAQNRSYASFDIFISRRP
jgi:hypothetical protein